MAKPRPLGRIMDDRDMRFYDGNHRHPDCPWVKLGAVELESQMARLKAEHPEWPAMRVRSRAIIEAMKAPLDVVTIDEQSTCDWPSCSAHRPCDRKCVRDDPLDIAPVSQQGAWGAHSTSHIVDPFGRTPEMIRFQADLDAGDEE